MLKGSSFQRKARVENTLSLEGVMMTRFDKPIDLSSPNRRRITQSGVARGHSMLSSVSQALSESMNPKPSLESPPTTDLHECPVVIDPEFKNAEEKLAFSDVETPDPNISLSSTLGETPIIE
ncbi:unnamed protein product [Lactuca saligna]|uniref:Uncharacterized protein n=1 Tax=Lactuca saligna TaxID=75948 RepID=A0AA35V254_LACSI|nr:unnamed protein product [Lactuca saligna]